MTKIISGFPCIGKTSIGNSNKLRYNDLEFRETAAQRGMSKEDRVKLFDNYVNIVELIANTGYYDYLFITDNFNLVNRLIERGIEFIYVVPDPKDVKFLTQYKERVLLRNDLNWFENIVTPKLEILNSEIDKIKRYENGTIMFLSIDKPFLKDLIFSD